MLNLTYGMQHKGCWIFMLLRLFTCSRRRATGRAALATAAGWALRCRPMATSLRMSHGKRAPLDQCDRSAEPWREIRCCHHDDAWWPFAPPGAAAGLGMVCQTQALHFHYRDIDRHWVRGDYKQSTLASCPSHWQWALAWPGPLAPEAAPRDRGPQPNFKTW